MAALPQHHHTRWCPSNCDTEWCQQGTPPHTVTQSAANGQINHHQPSLDCCPAWNRAPPALATCLQPLIHLGSGLHLALRLLEHITSASSQRAAPGRQVNHHSPLAATELLPCKEQLSPAHQELACDPLLPAMACIELLLADRPAVTDHC